MIFLLVFNPPSCHPPSCCQPDVQFVIPTQEGSQLPIKKIPQSYSLHPVCHPPSCCHPDVQFVIPTQEGSQIPIKKFPQSYLLRNDKLRGCCHPPISLPSSMLLSSPRAVCHPPCSLSSRRRRDLNSQQNKFLSRTLSTQYVIPHPVVIPRAVCHPNAGGISNPNKKDSSVVPPSE